MKGRILTGWTPEQDAELISLLNGDRSAAKIAAILGRTRNQVMGRYDRLRILGALPPGARLLSQKAKAERAARRPKTKHPLVSQKLLLQRRVQINTFDRPPTTYDRTGIAVLDRFAEGYEGQAGRVSILDVKEGMCRFPVDQPNGSVLCCGLGVEKNGSYCPGHAARAYQQKP